MTLQYDPQQAVALLAAADRPLARVIERVGPFNYRPPRMQSPFESLLRAITSQQLSSKAANTIHGRLQELLPRRGADKPAAVLKLTDEQLRGAGLSRSKVASVKDLAAKTLDGTVPALAKLRRMSDAEVIERLVAVRGVGVWTVEMLLIFRLGRPDVLPVDDLGIRKGFMKTFRTRELPEPHKIITRGEKWRPYRSVASWYLWRSLE